MKPHSNRQKSIAWSPSVLLLACLLLLSGPSSASAKEVIAYFGTESGSGSLGGEFNVPGDIAVNYTGAGPGNQGDIFVIDAGNSRIQRFAQNDNGTPGNPYDDTYPFVSAWGADVDGATPGEGGYEICTVAANCKAGVSSAGNGSLAASKDQERVSGIAIDQDTGDVYLSDAGNLRVNVYAGDGSFLRSFGFDVVESGSGDSGAGFEVCVDANGDVCKKGVGGAGLGQIGGPDQGGIAVSTPDGNADSGRVFLADFINRRVNVYDFDGTPLESIGSAVNFDNAASPRHVAVDSRGVVYITDGTNNSEVDRYDSENANGSGVGFLAPIPVPPLSPANTQRKGLEVDPDSDGAGPDTDILYVLRDGANGTTVVQQFGPVNDPGLTTPPIADDDGHGALIGFNFVEGLGFDVSNGRLFVSDRRNVGGPFLGGTTNHGVYVLDTAGGAPTATLDSLSDLTSRTVKVHATVDPNGPPEVGYQLEYSTDGSKWRQTSKIIVGSQEDPQTVEATLEPPPLGLEPNTTYHVRLSVAKLFAPAFITDELTFTTSVEPPLVETSGAPVRTVSTAQLNGRVSPRNVATSYHFEYSGQGSCSANPCESTSPVAMGSGNGQRLVSAEITGLAPGTTYHYRLVAGNGAPGSPSFGEDMTLTTRASEAPLSHGHFPGSPGSDRAYEMVSIPDSGGNPVFETGPFSTDGNRAVYSIAGGTPISDTGSFASFYFAERTDEGWQQKNITPPRDELVGPNWSLGVSAPDLSTINVLNQDAGASRSSLWRLSPQAEPTQIFDVTPPMTLGTPGAAVGQIKLFASHSPRTVAMLYPTGPSTSSKNLYDVTSGSPELVSLLPGNTVPDCGPDGNLAAFEFAIELSSDGRFLVFPSQGDGPCNSAPSRLYLRDLEQDETTLVTPSPVSGPECGSGIPLRLTSGAFFFWTQERLSPEDTPPSSCADSGSPPDGDVYRYEIESGVLQCVTCVIVGLDADVEAGLGQGGAGAMRVTADGSRAYFRSLSSVPLVSGATLGQESTYVVDTDTGDLRWVSPAQIEAFSASVVGSSGKVVLFTSNSAQLNPLGGTSDNGGTTQLYRYDDNDRSLVCISCPQDGSAPSSSVVDNLASSADGNTIAFITPTALVPADQNTPAPGQNPVRGTDIYEWRDGRLFLVTDGLTDWPPFAEPRVASVSPSGRDLFFTAYVQYTPDALDAYNRLYDARIGGGFEYPEPPVPCPLEVCQGTPKGAPEEAAPGTGALSGPGNLRPAPTTKARCPKGKRKVRRAGKARCVKRRPAREGHNRQANRDRRVGR